MATNNSADIVTLHQPRPMTAAERAKNYRLRKKAKQGAVEILAKHVPAPSPRIPVDKKATSSDLVALAPAQPRVTPIVTHHAVTPSRRSPASITLIVSAVAMAAVGVTMNGWFARSLGSSELAGWLFLAIGVTADLVALAIPSCAAALWQARQFGTAAAAWTVWLATFAFAVMAGVGFASVNIADVTTARASRITPAVTVAQTAYADAVAARDRECKSGTGKFCREREAQVVERRQALDTAMRAIEVTADPQIEAASNIVVWISGGMIKPGTGDIAMLRLILLALLPQLGGILLMLGRTRD